MEKEIEKEIEKEMEMESVRKYLLYTKEEISEIISAKPDIDIFLPGQFVRRSSSYERKWTSEPYCILEENLNTTYEVIAIHKLSERSSRRIEPFYYILRTVTGNEEPGDSYSFWWSHSELKLVEQL